MTITREANSKNTDIGNPINEEEHMRCLTLIIRRARNSLLLLLFAFLVPTVVIADAKDVAFGTLGEDGTISNIIYYRNGSWERTFEVSYSDLPSPHGTILWDWVEAHRRGLEVDCKDAMVGVGEDDRIHREYTCKLPRPMGQISAEELIAYLATIRPTDPQRSGERIKFLTPSYPARILAWENAQERGARDNMDLQTYAKIFWNSVASAFSQWYRLNVPNTVPILAIHAYIGGSSGDCSADAAVIRSNSGSDKHSRPGWVATQRSGFTWSPFEEVAYVIFDPKHGKGHPRTKTVPAELEPLVTQIKSRWSDLEESTVPKLKMSTEHHEEAKKSLRATPFFNLTIQRTVSSHDKTTLLFFTATKYFHSPFLTHPIDRESVVIRYRGWALLHPNGRTGWPSAFVALEPTGNANVDSYISLSPYALVELDGRRYLVADSTEHFGNAAAVRTEVLELVDGKFRSRGIYPGTCN